MIWFRTQLTLHNGQACTQVNPSPRTILKYSANPDCVAGSRPKSKCEVERDSVSQFLIGAFIPKCEKDGSYSKIQCHGSTGSCWCVDEQGRKLEETETRFSEPDCDKGIFSLRKGS